MFFRNGTVFYCENAHGLCQWVVRVKMKAIGEKERNYDGSGEVFADSGGSDCERPI